MKFLVLALICGFLAFGQPAISAAWIGTWELNVQKSTFGPILVPGAPEGFKVLGQTLKIEATAQKIEASGDTVFSDHAGTHTGHDDVSLPLDGTATKVGPVTFSFKRIDDFTFQIATKLDNLSEMSEFKFATDGKTLTETKTQTGADKKTSRSVLVFSKT
jgi:hypothetical protein